ncbi:unnamed protein product [Arctogadus glacialis]
MGRPATRTSQLSSERLTPELIHSPSTPPLKSLSGAALGLIMCDSQVELIGGLLPPASLVTGLYLGRRR